MAKRKRWPNTIARNCTYKFALCGEFLHFIIDIYFFEQLSIKLNEEDDHGILPLDIALKTKQEDLAQNLIDNHVNIGTVT